MKTQEEIPLFSIMFNGIKV